MMAQNSTVTSADGRQLEFDAFWSSSLTDSASYGLPDNEVLSPRARLANIDNIFSVTSKPLIMDGDTGGFPEHFEIAVRDMERQGVSAVIIEDKCGLKQNSLLGASSQQWLAPVDQFCEKIQRGKSAQVTHDFNIYARLESLILEAGMDDALTRAHAYVAAGADGIMIHSRNTCGGEILDFAKLFRQDNTESPLIAVPTTYHSLRIGELEDAGFSIIIYANHMLRASLKAMREVCQLILKQGRTSEAESMCIDISELLDFRYHDDVPVKRLADPSA
jgi:phosphoenolpyruvate phosphomutase